MNFKNQDSILNILLNQIGDMVVANLLFILFSLPIITIGPALCGLYTIFFQKESKAEISIFQEFVKGFRKNLKDGIIFFLGILVLLSIILGNIYFLRENQTSLGFSFLLLTVAVAIPLSLASLYLFPILTFFENKNGYYLQMSFFLSIRHLPRSIALFIITSLLPLMTYWDSQLRPLYAFFWFFIGFSLLALIHAKCLYPILVGYLKKE